MKVVGRVGSIVQRDGPMRLNASVNEPVAPILHLAQDKPHLLLDKWLFSAHIIIPIMYYKSYVDIR